ncbi:UDP-N-acetylglucosamine--undecaprenyl-phosphate N-acetylglucosaminephosphotransferase [Photobacterium ganghwense]|uniref:UDP-N-acetylglucosamine--undecaprenyl-phosphate N-acetylglucosaminephosphotransferase n=1 Tax=Photobacterium ganghwense TaxID=320778 RepID=UPI0040568B8E
MDVLPFFIFAIALCNLLIFRKIALRLQWVDIPSARKLHSGTPPLCGGASIFITLLIALLIHPISIPELHTVLACASVLFVTGLADDKYNVEVKLRLLIQCGVAYVMVNYGDCRITELGSLTGSEKVVLSHSQSTIISVLAIVGGINAFNMIDGVDGLLGGMTIVCFTALGYLFYIHDVSEMVFLCSIIVVATVPFLLLNTGIFCRPKHKVFMGDAGSTLLGFILVWLLILSSQPLDYSASVHSDTISTETISNQIDTILKPVTALWIIAIPLMDMVAVMVQRTRRGYSPFLPDRTHLHHTLLQLGLNAQLTSLLICIIGVILAILGIYFEISGISEEIQLVVFMVVFLFYLLITQYIFQIKYNLRKAYRLIYKL